MTVHVALSSFYRTSCHTKQALDRCCPSPQTLSSKAGARQSGAVSFRVRDRKECILAMTLYIGVDIRAPTNADFMDTLVVRSILAERQRLSDNAFGSTCEEN